ncbi:ABC transporter substrate-binding protein [Variovorax terrae]|uniref:ABC transporter substrate-binding protein n=1 Tax=Variovorax terrae TaxID=2923278 RepID=A0A9X1VTF8_9BURK|nr:ABC transporter substrate-binding protein [Variovorax terrae]MCJ0763045.1 ABC transporter substrate-binding protein [Variovorax terrae]
MALHLQPLNRRKLLQCAAAMAAGTAAAVRAQPGKTPPPSRQAIVAQIVDMSPGQQDVSRDFLVGSRAAWQDINARGGLRGRPVQHLSIETDGSAAGARAALGQIRDNPACVALSGTVGDPLAGQVAALLRQDNLGIAHAAPWLQNSSVEVDERTFPIFAARQEQIGHALKSLSIMGVQELGAIYASAHEQTLYREDVERIAASMKLKLLSLRPESDLKALGQRLKQDTPAILLFVGGTPELVQFTQGLEKQARQRYVVALADVNLQTMAQMGAARNTPVIVTQAVPMVTASLPVVRAYRETLARLFDEAPTSLSLAGFIAARYTYEVLNDLDGALTRQNALAAFQRRASLDVGGYRISFNPQRRSGTYVTQSMLTTDGRVVG